MTFVERVVLHRAAPLLGKPPIDLENNLCIEALGTQPV